MEMRILLLSRNRVVQELVKLGIKGREEIRLEIADSLSEVRGDHFDLLLADDQLAERVHGEELEHLIAGRRILLGKAGGSVAEGYDAVLGKPFLPGDIERLLGQRIDLELEEEEDLREFLEGELASGTEVLDAEEIQRIRQLLDEGTAETPEQEEEREPRKRPGEERSYDVESLLEMLERVKPKQLRKLLRGATVHIRIEFPEET
jgi:hypothetical protein